MSRLQLGSLCSGADLNNLTALELNPNFIRAHFRYCSYLSIVGRHEEAIAEANRIKELDPQNVLSHLILPNALLMARRFDEGIVEIKKAIELDPMIFGSYMALGSAYSAKGMHAEAIAAFAESERLGGKGVISADLSGSNVRTRRRKRKSCV